jgi:DNA-binding GntR family transcriptional regulator
MQNFIERAQACKRFADLEKLLYERAGGRASRSDCKTLIAKMRRLIRAETAGDKKNFMLQLLKVKQEFFEVIAR